MYWEDNNPWVNPNPRYDLLFVYGCERCWPLVAMFGHHQPSGIFVFCDDLALVLSTSPVSHCSVLWLDLIIVHVYLNPVSCPVLYFTVKPLQMIQNAAARLVFNQPKRAHVTPLLIELHWLPVAACIKFKSLMLA